MGMLRWQLFTAFPKISKECSACLLCSDEGSFPLQGAGKLISQVNGFVQLNPYSLPLRSMHHQPAWLE